MSDDLHTPTTAAPEPTPVVTEADATASHPVGTAAPPYAAPAGSASASASPAEKPEVQAAAAFAGGLALALILKRLGR